MTLIVHDSDKGVARRPSELGCRHGIPILVVRLCGNAERVAPSAIVSVVVLTATVLTPWATVAVALPDADPAVAVIVAVPFVAAVTSPEALTVATAAALLDQLTAAPAISLPFWSRTSAVNCSVAPKAVSCTVAGATPTVAGRRGSEAMGGGSVPPSHAGVNRRRTQPADG